jgi:peroxiredoxin
MKHLLTLFLSCCSLLPWGNVHAQTARFEYNGKGITLVKDESGRIICGKELKQWIESGTYTIQPVLKADQQPDYFLIRKLQAGEKRSETVKITDIYTVSDSLSTGMFLPQFQLSDLNGNVWTSESLKGKITILHIWKMYNAACDEEIYALNKLYKKYVRTPPDAGIQILAISSDKADGVKRYKREQIVEYPLIPQAEALIQSLGLRFVPATIVVDRQGRIYNFIPGALKAYYPLIERDLNGLGSGRP